MTKTLLIAGTASHVGKSTIAAGLCRLLAERGVDVAPFKAQNMSNNARVVVRPGATGTGDCGSRPVDGPEATAVSGSGDGAGSNGGTGPGGRPGANDDQWGEIGVSQFVQARAARVTPTTDCNPVLLKPRGDGQSQLLLHGRAVDHVTSGAYYETHWDDARDAAVTAYERLAADAEVVVAEGAGSIAEINLHDRDLANVELARFADAEILLLVDIERGGAFASLYGTLELLPDDLHERVAGAVITKFRGDPSLLDAGIDEIESRTGVPVLGVVPYDDPGLPEEDSVGLPARTESSVAGDGDGVPEGRRVTVAVPRFPRISNATDLEALASTPGVRVAYLPVDASAGSGRDEPLEAVGADAVVLPGTKNTADDLLALREAGLHEAVRSFDGPIVGICGGYQMLGERLTNAALESTTDRDEIDGIGLLPVETRFGSRKRVERTTVRVEGAGPIRGVSGTASGYEIHAGETTALEPVERPLGPSSAVRGDVLGTYLHGLFDDEAIREAFVDAVYESAGVDRPGDSSTGSHAGDSESAAGTGLDGDHDAVGSPYDRAATLVAEHVDLSSLGLPVVE